MAADFETIGTVPSHVAVPLDAVLQSIASLQWAVKERTGDSVVASVPASGSSWGETVTVTLRSDRTVRIHSACKRFQVTGGGKNKENVYALLAALEQVSAPTAHAAAAAATPISSIDSSPDARSTPSQAQHELMQVREKNNLRNTMVSVAGFAIVLVIAGFQFWEWTQERSGDAGDQIGPDRVKKLFDTSIAPEQRLTMATQLVVGQFHTVSPLGFYNYDFREDGTWSAEFCMPQGEISERKYGDYGSGTWTVEEQRYRDSGKIYYAVSLGGEYRLTDFIITRDGGFQAWLGAGDGARAMTTGFSSNCSYPEER